MLQLRPLTVYVIHIIANERVVQTTLICMQSWHYHYNRFTTFTIVKLFACINACGVKCASAYLLSTLFDM